MYKKSKIYQHLYKKNWSTFESKKELKISWDSTFQQNVYFRYFEILEFRDVLLMPNRSFDSCQNYLSLWMFYSNW
jgi:hypothetical protein